MMQFSRAHSMKGPGDTLNSLVGINIQLDRMLDFGAPVTQMAKNQRVQVLKLVNKLAQFVEAVWLQNPFVFLCQTFLSV